MKTLLYITIVIVLGSGCRSIKEKQQRHYREDQIASDGRHYRSFHLWNSIDSTDRSWRYATDLPFYFHPDSGLYAMAGELYAQEYLVDSRSSVHVQDSTSWQEQQSGISRSERSYSSTGQRWIGWGIGAVVSLIVVANLYWRRRV